VEFRPYVGAGIGLITAKLAYRSAYQRNHDAAGMRGLGRHPAAVGTLSLQDAILMDRLRTSYRLPKVLTCPRRRLVFGDRLRMCRVRWCAWARKVR
jgi:hypothetical protein